jgi:ribosomal protein S18 acetylase RimI-like enzyme
VAIVVRQARLDDGPVLARIDYNSWSPASSPSPRWSSSRPFFGPPTNTRTDDVIVAERDGSVVGYVKVKETGPDEVATIQINGLAVADAARGDGLGARLVSEAKALARRRGYGSIELKVLGSNTPAIRVYRTAGFTARAREAGRFVNSGHPVNDITMTAQL